jgi:DNA phosphorothioation-associated putative methyltransferase
MVGKRVRAALYVHRAALSRLTPEQQATVTRAATQTVRPWNVARLEPTVVGLLLYEDFATEAFPALLASTRVDLATGSVSHREFANTANPLILHRKEQLVAPDMPGLEAWIALTSALEALGCFKDPHLIGRRRAWSARLADACVRVEGHQLCPR